MISGSSRTQPPSVMDTVEYTYLPHVHFLTLIGPDQEFVDPLSLQKVKATKESLQPFFPPVKNQTWIMFFKWIAHRLHIRLAWDIQVEVYPKEYQDFWEERLRDLREDRAWSARSGWIRACVAIDA